MTDNQKTGNRVEASENCMPSAHRFRYVLRYITWVWDGKETANIQVERAWSVPFLWLAALILWVRREAWFMGGSVTDAMTGRTLYHVYLAGIMLGDGRAHVGHGRAPDAGERFRRERHPPKPTSQPRPSSTR